MTGSPAAAPCVWLTGRRGAGKRTVAELAAASWRTDGHRCAALVASDLAAHLRLGPTEGGLESLAWLVNLLTGNGVTVIVAADTPRRDDRVAVAGLIDGFVEVFIDAPANVCAARAGVEDRVYEEPIALDRRVPTGDRDERASAALLVSYLDALTDPSP